MHCVPSNWWGKVYITTRCCLNFWDMFLCSFFSSLNSIQWQNTEQSRGSVWKSSSCKCFPLGKLSFPQSGRTLFRCRFVGENVDPVHVPQYSLAAVNSLTDVFGLVQLLCALLAAANTSLSWSLIQAQLPADGKALTVLLKCTFSSKHSKRQPVPWDTAKGALCGLPSSS